MHLSLRLRLSLAALFLAALAVLAAALAVGGLARSNAHAHEAMAAQRRVEAYGAYAARVNEWMLSWRLEAGTPERAADPAPVLALLDMLDLLVAADVENARDTTDENQRARQSMSAARLRGLFGQLNATLARSPPGSSAGDAAIAFYFAQAPGVIAQQSEHDMRRRDQALAQMESLQRLLNRLAIAIAVIVPILLALLYVYGFKPFFSRLATGARGLEPLIRDGGISRGQFGHDELGLMLARLRQMARRIERRRQRLEADYAQLESLVAGRTAELSEANTKLAQIDASRRRFFADVSHELRTPLTVIMGEAELLSLSPDEGQKASASTILIRARRLMARIEDLLRIARSDSGQLELARDPIALRDLVAAAHKDLAPVLRRAGLTLHYDLPNLTLAGDGDWLRQVIGGILENAAKYAGRNAQVEIRASESDRMARITIADTGPGLPPDEAARIFERFTRGNSSKQTSPAAAKGFGVGLALARWVVEASGGRLHLGEGEKAGLTLHMDLPLWEGADGVYSCGRG